MALSSSFLGWRGLWWDGPNPDGPRAQEEFNVAWVKIDDQFYDNSKVLAAGPHAVALHLAAMCWVGGQLSDGRIPRHVLPALTGKAQVPARTVDRLVTVGLWLSTDDGWEINDWLEWNPPAAQVRAERAAGKERAAKSRRTRGERAPNVQPGCADPSPSPSVPSEPHSGSRFADGQTRPAPLPVRDNIDLRIEPGTRSVSDLRGVLRSVREEPA